MEGNPVIIISRLFLIRSVGLRVCIWVKLGGGMALPRMTEIVPISCLELTEGSLFKEELGRTITSDFTEVFPELLPNYNCTVWLTPWPVRELSLGLVELEDEVPERTCSSRAMILGRTWDAIEEVTDSETDLSKPSTYLRHLERKKRRHRVNDVRWTKILDVWRSSKYYQIYLPSRKRINIYI